MKKYLLISLITLFPALVESFTEKPDLIVRNGWFTYKNCVVIGYGQRTDYWGGYQSCQGNPEWIHRYKTYNALTRNDVGSYGPCKTEEFAKFTRAMVKYGYPAFMHNYGLWYDRRRDCHDEGRRDTPPEGPFHEQPWARSAIPGAWDGGNKYDLLKFNEWYFNRLKEFAGQCGRKGTILIYQFYNQHHILESPCHYVDFPWRPINCIQNTGLPDSKPANDLTVYNQFYDTKDSIRRLLHMTYIRKCLDELSPFSNVVFEISREYTGPFSFTQFWIDTILDWEKETGKDVMVSIGATKDVQDLLLSDPVRSPGIDVINLAYWWYLPDGKLNAPTGGKGIPGRYADGTDWAKKTTPFQIHRQVKECRQKYPEKAIIHAFEGSREQTLAFFMGGGSILIRYLKYPDSKPPLNPWDPPVDYIMPESSSIVLPFYSFINRYLKTKLPFMTGKELVSKPEQNWCLGQEGKNYLVYALKGGEIKIDLSDDPEKNWKATWVNPQDGELKAEETPVFTGRKIVTFAAPDTTDWLLWIH